MTLNPVVPLNAKIPEWTFAERLRKARRELRINQEQMSARMGVKRSTYEAWETGRNKPDLADIAPRLEEVTGITRLWFLGWTEVGNNPDGPNGLNTRASGYKRGNSLSPDDNVTPMFRALDPGYITEVA